MKTIHDLIKAINALKLDPSESYIPARPITAELVIKAQAASYHPMAMLVVKIGDSIQSRLYAEADPITQTDWQESMLRAALTQIKTHNSILYIALGEPEIEPEPASPELPKNCRLLTLDEAREIRTNGRECYVCDEEQGALEYDVLQRPAPILGANYYVVARRGVYNKPTLLLVISNSNYAAPSL